MSYDHWILPAHLADDTRAAIAHVIAQHESGAPGTRDAQAIADAITEKNSPLDDDTTFLSVHPVEAAGNVVIVPSPFPSVERARAEIIPIAFTAGFAVYDPQYELMLDPRNAMPGRFVAWGHSAFPVITPPLVDRFVHTMEIDDFVIAENLDETYIQSKRVGTEEFLLEYRDGSPDRHFGTTVTTADEVASALHGWLTGDDSSYRMHQWTKLNL